MGALNSLRPAASSLVRNPVLLVVTGLFALAQLPMFVLQLWFPLLSAVISLVLSGVFLFFVPFYQGGILGMARDALAEGTALSTFISAGKSNYLPLLIGYGVLLVINSVILTFGYVTAIVAAVLMADSNPGTAFFAVLGAVGLLLLFAYLGVLFFFQFYGHAIVLDDTDTIDAFEHSIALVRTNLLSVLGYSVITAIGGGGLGLVGALASLAFMPERPDVISVIEFTPSVLVAAAVLYVLAIAISGAFWSVYSVAFYQSIGLTRTGTGRTARETQSGEFADV